MKVKFLAVVIFLLLFSSLAAVVNAQQSIDQKIDSVQKEIEELKRRKLAALEKLRDELKNEVGELESGQSPSGDRTAVTTTGAPNTANTASRSRGAASGETASGTNNAASANNANTNGTTTSGGNTPRASATAARNTSGTNTTAGRSAALAIPAAVPAGAPAGGNIQTPCLAQKLDPTNFSRAQSAVCDLAAAIVQHRSEEGDKDLGILLNDVDGDFIKIIVASKLAGSLGASPEDLNKFDKAARTFLLESEKARKDKQAGSDSKGAGTTSLAVKGGVPAFLNWAIENGGAEGSRDGNTITFRVNPVGLADSLYRWGETSGLVPATESGQVDGLFRNDDDLVRVLRNTSVGFSFDITRGTDPLVLVGSKQQLSAVSVRYQFLNRQDPRNSRYKDDWNAYRIQQQKFSNAMTAVEDNIKTLSFTDDGKFKNVDLNAWLTNANTALASAASVNVLNASDLSDVERVRAVLEQEIAKLPLDKLKNDTTLVGALTTFVNGHVTLGKEFERIMKKVANGEVATFEYTNYRNVHAPDLSNFRFIFSKGFWEGADFTFNGSLTMFNKKPISANPAVTIKRIRDFDFTMQLDLPFSSSINRAKRVLENPQDTGSSIMGIPVLTFAGKYQRLQSDAVMADGVVAAGTKGDLALGQAKLTIPINFNGFTIKLPVSITFSNRTDLIKEKEIRGNFGFTLDIDPFFTALKNSLAGGLFRP